jgi:hypothetical protein
VFFKDGWLGLHEQDSSIGDVGIYQSVTCDIGWRNGIRIVENERSVVNKGTFCSRKISQDVRDFAAKEGIAEAEALAKGMEVKSVEFVKQGAEVYHKA